MPNTFLANDFFPIFVHTNQNTMNSYISQLSPIPGKYDIWKNVIACLHINSDIAHSDFIVKHFVNCYMFTIGLAGKVVFNFNGRDTVIEPNVLVVGTPNSKWYVKEYTSDYEAVCLVVSANFSTENFIQSRLLRAACFPNLNQVGGRTLLTTEMAKTLHRTFEEMASRIREDPEGHYDSLQALFALFLSDFVSFLETLPAWSSVNTKYFTFLISFMESLQVNYKKEHTLAFYADQLHISTRYFSKAIHDVTGGFTPAYFIHRKLYIESCWMLKYTDHSIQQIADDLYFSDQASFSKFFKRQNGISPSEYRNSR